MKKAKVTDKRILDMIKDAECGKISEIKQLPKDGLMALVKSQHDQIMLLRGVVLAFNQESSKIIELLKIGKNELDWGF